MKHELHQMTNAQLKQYISEHRNDEEAFRAALEVLISRRDPNAPYQPYPFNLSDPESEVQAIFVEKLNFMGYPITLSTGIDEIKSGVFMETSCTLNESGQLNIWTRSWAENLIEGAHSRVNIFLLGANNNNLWNTGELACGIGGKAESLLNKNVKSDRSETFNKQVPTDLLSQVKSIRIIHSDKPKTIQEYLEIILHMIEPQQSGDQSNKGDTYNVGQAGAVGRNARSDNNNFYQSEQNKTLADAAAEIQNLLRQLEQTNPTATETEKVAYVNDETTPSFKRRVAGALQASGETAIDEFILENKYLKVAKAAFKGWLQPDS